MIFSWWLKIKKVLVNKFFQNFGIVYFSSIINGGSLFLINVILARALTKEWFGVFSLAILALSTVAETSDFGLNGGLLRFAPWYLAKGELDKLKQLVKTIWTWRVRFSIILTILGVSLAYPLSFFIFKQPILTNYLAFSFAGIGGVVLLGFVSVYLQAEQKFFQNAIIQMLKGSIRFILILVLILLGVRNLYYFLAVYILVPWILFVFSFHYLPKNFRGVEIEAVVKKQLHSQLARFSFWLTISSLAGILASRIDQVMLGNLLGLSEVAIYSVAFQTIYLYILASQAMTAILLPKINSLLTRDDLVVFIKRIFHWLVPAVLVGSALIYPSKFIILWLFGSRYEAAIPLYLILSFSMMISLLIVPSSLIIIAYKKTQLVALSSLVQLIINVVFNLIFIPKFGAIGAALTFAIGFLWSLGYNAWWSKKFLKQEFN